MVTYNKLLKVFNDIADTHYQITRFGNGPIEDINTFAPENTTFPILWVVPQGITLGENAMTYSMRVLVFDIVESDDSNDDEVLSDAALIMNDVFQMLKNDSADFTVTNSPLAIPFNQRFIEYCSGWYADIDIEVATINARCQLPTS